LNFEEKEDFKIIRRIYPGKVVSQTAYCDCLNAEPGKKQQLKRRRTYV
jgi:hypothetical protein